MKKFWISFIALLMGVVIGVGIWHGIAYKDKLESFAKESWDKIKSVFVKKDNNQPTEEQINLDGLYYLVVDGDITFVQIKDSKYGTIHGYIQDSKIYLASDWESEIELEPLHITEDEKYLHVFWINQENGREDKIAIYDKATKKLYYDFSNGKQFPGETYEDQLLLEMIKFENFELHEQHSFNEIVYSCAPSCYDAGREIRQCLCGKTEIVETSSALGHNYVDGKCTRCGESDPNYVEEVSSIVGLYYRANTDGTINAFQIEGDRFVIFTGYTQNGDASKIYFPSDWTTYLEGFGNSLTIEENDTQIICSVPEFMEKYKDNEQLYEVFKNYFVYDKETKELRFGMNKVILTRIDAYNILPYEEPRISIENDILHLSDMTSVGGTYTVYYQFVSGSYEGEYPDSYFEEQAYVAGNVTEFDLSLLVNRESVPMLKGCTYRIRVVFATNDGFLIRGYESVQYTVPNAEHTHSYEWQTKIDATCISAGVEQGFCSCGASADREIPATGHTFDAGICTSCNALDEEFYSNFCGYWFTETTGFKKESFGKYYIQVYKDGDNYIFTRSGYKVENGEIVLYQNSTDYSDPETWTYTSINRINEFTLTRQDVIFNGTYDGQTLVVGDMTFTKTDKPIRYDGSTSYVTPL